MSGTAAFVNDWEPTSYVGEVLWPRLPTDVANSIRESRILDPKDLRTVDSPAYDSASAALSPVVLSMRSRVANYTALQEWDGYVVSMDENSFTARLTDLTADGLPDAEEVEIPYEEMDEASLNRMEPGSLFRWSIGYERSQAGQKTRVSRIIVRQLPRWRKDELERAGREAAHLSRAIKWQE